MAASKRKANRPRGCSGKGSKVRSDVRLLEGDSLELLGELEAESVDAIVTDPPYGIGFAQERWDSTAIRDAAAKAGHHRLTPNEAFEAWCRIWASECRRVMKPGAFFVGFGSPRTFHRLTCGVEDAGLEIRDTLMWLYGTGMTKSRRYPEGRTTSLKPFFEPILLARRAPDGTVLQTLAEHGTGTLDAKSCHVGRRHPANVIASHEPGCTEDVCSRSCPARIVDESRSRGEPPSRFIYCAKVSRAERNAGCEDLPKQDLDLFTGKPPRWPETGNPHPTLKPLELMRWLVRLVCPAGGLVLDPFSGAGSTGAATVLEGRRFVGIELEPAYMEIAAARIAHWSPGDDRKPKVYRAPLGRRE